MRRVPCRSARPAATATATATGRTGDAGDTGAATGDRNSGGSAGGGAAPRWDLRRCLAQASRVAARKRETARRACRTRHGRTPGRIRGLRARATSSTSIVLSFVAPGSNGDRAPAARVYLVKQSRRPIRGSARV